MLKNLEAEKEAVKAKMNQRIEEYFKAFEKGSNEEKFTINEIERLMVENELKMKEIMIEANSEMAGSMKADVKKNARSAEEG